MSLEHFIRLADSIVEFDLDLNENKFPIDSVHAVEVHRFELKSTWTRIRTAYEKYLSDRDDEEERSDNDSSNVESFKLKYKSTYITYCKCLTKLAEISDELRQLSVPKNDSPIISRETISSNAFEKHGFQLPPCDIEIFNGDYMSWPTFRDLFTAMYIQNSRLSQVEKLFHLNQKTSGEARDIVRKSPLTNQGFDLAWSSLCERFENRRVLVNGQLKLLFGLETITSESGKAIKKLQRDISSCISNLQLYKVDVKYWDPIFIYICSNKLPDSTLTLWEESLKDKSSIPKWSEFDIFLTNRYRTLESVSEMRHKITDSKPKASNSQPRKFQTFQQKVFVCQLCPKESHPIRKCQKFLKMIHSQRLAEIKRLGLCINCFSKAHTVKNCSSQTNCYKCNKRHNTLLHRDPENLSLPTPNTNTNSNLNPHSTPFSSKSSSTPQSINNSGVEGVKSFCNTSSRGVLLGTALVDICCSDIKYRARALIDSGSEGTLISERLFHRLKLPHTSTNAKISGLNNSISAHVQIECSLTLGSIFDSDIELPVNAFVVPHLSGNLPSTTINSISLSNITITPLADPYFHKSSKIDILIGADLMPSIMLTGVKHDVCGSLMAQETIFGWILTGPISNDSSSFSSTIVSHFTEISLDKEISRFWELEDLPRSKLGSSSDKFCEDLFTNTTKRNEEGRYIVSLPFKEIYPHQLKLGHSRTRAMAQYFRNEGRLLRSPIFKEEYDQVVQEYKELGHMTKVFPETGPNTIDHFYMPHHAVIRPDSTTTKVRVVFNASSPTSNGHSLNDMLYPKNVQTNSSRSKTYSFPTNPLSEIHKRMYSGQTNVFRTYLAIRTMLQLADDSQSIYPRASYILRNSIYVDDVLAGTHKISEALECRKELILALESAGFSLRKWTANSKEILSGIPNEHLLFQDFLDFEDSSRTKTLGIRWNAKTDSFYFTTKPIPETFNRTKREVLSQIAKLFDPAGWLAPCIILAKIIMQRIWIDGTGWDEVLTPESLSKWNTFQVNYHFINDIQVPRWIQYTPHSEVQFHGFCDASERAYAAVLYIRIVQGSNTFVHLITSKTKVAPVKTLSIPRLELCGAVLLSEMIDTLLPKLNVKTYSTYCWTDSSIVLSWLAKPPCSWMTFVANRISKIIQITDSSLWKHVCSDSNPADLASRGLYPQELKGNNLWWHGPEWLRKSPEKWPKSNPIAETNVESKQFKVHFTYFSNHEDILERFSSFPKALRVLAYVYRFFFKTHIRYRNSFYIESTIVKNSEIVFVRNKLISIVQKVHFPNEYHALSLQKNIETTSSILNLNPFLDSDGILRSCGRLESSLGLMYNERYPIIIPYNCQYSRLLVHFIHSISLHGGNQLVLRLVRTQYWIPRVKNLIKTIINKCKVCIIYKKKCQRQLMGALPPERIEISRPFTHAGLDFAGPFEIKTYSGRSFKITKGYVCVFVCFTTKAIHLEATSDLSTPAFLAAFSRFVSRRGCPLHLHSDNGKTFVGASKILAQEFIQSSRQSIIANYAHQNITWHFIPPGAPHMGGLWEAGVKSFKYHFRRFSSHLKYTFEEFSTLLTRIEACLNSRPLSPISQDPSDLSALTPGHFLIGSPILVPIDPNINEASISIVNRRQRLKLIYKNFCSRWKNEYLKEQLKRTKWKISEENLKENTLVVIFEENLPPNCWRLGRIRKVYLGSNNRVRVADVYTQRGIVTRPITKLIALPFNS